MRAELQDLPEPNWFHHGEQILALLETHRPVECVELGSNRGCSAIATARLIRRWGGRLTCVDLWTAGPNEVRIDAFADNVLAAGVASSIRMVYSRTDDAARVWRGQIDYLYIDADHTVEGCLSDLVLWWPFVKVGGLVAGDDYDDPHGIPSRGVTKAWDTFEHDYGQTFIRQRSPNLLGCQCEACQSSRLIYGVKR